MLLHNLWPQENMPNFGFTPYENSAILYPFWCFVLSKTNQQIHFGVNLQIYHAGHVMLINLLGSLMQHIACERSLTNNICEVELLLAKNRRQFYANTAD